MEKKSERQIEKWLYKILGYCRFGRETKVIYFRKYR